jgi:hypothetical protein
LSAEVIKQSFVQLFPQKSDFALSFESPAATLACAVKHICVHCTLSKEWFVALASEKKNIPTAISTNIASIVITIVFIGNSIYSTPYMLPLISNYL